MPGEILPTPGAGRNRDCSGAERFSAGYIARRIADHVNFGGGKFAAMFFFRPRARKLTQLIAIVVIVRERTEFEKVPDAVMVELQLRAARNVAAPRRHPYAGVPRVGVLPRLPSVRGGRPRDQRQAAREHLRGVESEPLRA